MAEAVTSTAGPSAIRVAAEKRPKRREFPDRRLFVIAVALIGLGSGLSIRVEGASANPAASSTWSHVVVVDGTHSAGPVLQAAFHRVAATGIGGNATAQVLKRLGEYIESEVAQRGKAGLSIELIVDAASASKAGSWPAEETARLVIALHRNFDQAQPQEWPKLQQVVERIRQGAAPDEILGTGDTLRETTPSRRPVPVPVSISISISVPLT